MSQTERDDETCRMLLRVLWRLRAHVHGESPLRPQNDTDVISAPEYPTTPRGPGDDDLAGNAGTSEVAA